MSIENPPWQDQRDADLFARVFSVVDTLVVPYFRAEVDGLAHLPEGPALLVGNHCGGSMLPEVWVLANALYKQYGLRGVPLGLTHQLAFDAPLVGGFLRKLGAVPASPESAQRCFDAGHKLMVYPGGDQEAYRPSRHRNRVMFFGRQGYIRLALRAGVPIVPVVTAGAHNVFWVLDDLDWAVRLFGLDRRLRVKTWPLVLSIPWGLTPFPPPLYLPFPARIRAEMLPPIRLPGDAATAGDPDAVSELAQMVETQMQATLDRLSA